LEEAVETGIALHDGIHPNDRARCLAGEHVVQHAQQQLGRVIQLAAPAPLSLSRTSAAARAVDDRQ
jgi:hypothetical protein